MASPKASLCAFFLLLLLLVATETAMARRLKYTPFDEKCLGLPQHVRNGTAVTSIRIEDITGALRDHGGYYAMATILDRDLRSAAFPFCGPHMAFFVDSHNRLTLIGQNASVTIFAPSDDSLAADEWSHLGLQIAMGRIADDGAVLSEGSKFDTASYRRPRLVVDGVFEDGTVSINDVKITEWDVYNDGRVLVHGTEAFFRYTAGGDDPMLGFDEHGVRNYDMSYFEMYGGEEGSSLLTKKMFMDPDHTEKWDYAFDIVQLTSLQELE